MERARASTSGKDFDGTSWKPTDKPGSLTSGVVVEPSSAYGLDAFRRLHRYDGASWKEVVGVKGERVWGSGPDDVWVVSTASNTAKHFDGVTWVDVLLPTKSEVIWGTSKTHVWVSGKDPNELFGFFTWRYDGATWTRFPAPLQGGPAVAFGGSGETDVFMIGATNRWVYRFDGAKFVMANPEYPMLATSSALYTRSAKETWVVGTKGALAMWDGMKWTPKDSATTNELEGIAGTSTSGPWLAGHWGALLEKR